MNIARLATFVPREAGGHGNVSRIDTLLKSKAFRSAIGCAVLLAAFSIMALPTAQAAPGNLLLKRTEPEPMASCCGIGVEYDGSKILYTHYGDRRIHFTDLSGADLGELRLRNSDGSLYTGDCCNAIAFNFLNGFLYGGGWSSTNLYKVDMSTGIVTLVKANAVPVYIRFIDGLAWDPTSNTFWMSDDVSCNVRHLDVNGNDIGGFNGCTVTGYSNSGLAVGLDGTLFYGTNGYGRIYSLDTTVNPPKNLGQFANPGGRDEDMSCGPRYTKADGSVVETLLSQDAYGNYFLVFEMAPGKCVSPAVARAPHFDVPPSPPSGTSFTVAVGDTLTFAIQASDPDEGDLVTLGVVDLPPGATFPIPPAANPVTSTFAWTLSTAGDRVVKFTARDQRLLSAPEHSIAIAVIPGEPPVAEAGAATGIEGSPVTFDGSASYDPAGFALSYRWDFDSDGVWDADWSGDPVAQFTWSDDHDGLAVLEVSNGWFSDTDTAEVTVGNLPPMADLPTGIAVAGEYVLVGNLFAQSYFVEVQAGGSLGSPVLIDDKVYASYGVGLGDYDNDGDLDALLGDGWNTWYYQKLGPGSNFAAGISIDSTVVPNRMDFAEADFNGDGNLDAIMAVYPSTTFTMYLGHGDGTFSRSLFPSPRLYIIGMDAADFNGDGNMDFVAAGYFTGPGGFLFLGNGDGTFGPAITFASSYSWGVSAGDFDNDGDADLVFGLSPVYFYPGNGDGTFAARVPLSFYAYAMAESDIDGDGNLDLLYTDGASMYYRGGNGDGTFTLRSTTSITTNAYAIAASDAGVLSEGDALRLRGTFVDPGWMDTHTAEWDWGDGGAPEAGSVTEENDPPHATGVVTGSHTFADDGQFTVALTVTDDDGGVGTDSMDVPVLNVNPKMVLVRLPPGTIPPSGTPITYTATFSDRGTLDTHAAVWTFDGVSAVGTVVESGGSGTVTDPFTLPAGVRRMTLRVTDDDGGYDEAANWAPIVTQFTATSAFEGQPVYYSMTAYDSDGDPLTLGIDFQGDGTIDTFYASGSTFSASFSFDDDFTGTARAYVGDGLLTSELTAPVLVQNLPPSVAITRIDATVPGFRPDEVFPPSATGVLATFEFNGDAMDVSGNGRDAQMLGGDFVPTQYGEGLHVYLGWDYNTWDVLPMGIDWSPYAQNLQHPYTIEMVLTPADTYYYQKLFSFDDTMDEGWYFVSQGVEAWPNPGTGYWQMGGGQRHYLAFVSTPQDTMDVYFQGVFMGNVASGLPATLGQAIFFRDDSATGRYEQLDAVVEALRISGVRRTQAEMDAIQGRLESVLPPVPVGTTVSFTGEFWDAGRLDTHMADWSFDGITVQGVVTETAGSGTVTGTYAFTSAGVYKVTLTVTDDDGGVGTSSSVYGLTALVVVYDPSAGFVTGGGWIDSPPGAYPSDPSLTGKATFGFVSKYLKGSNVPTGQTEFQFRVADLNFHSTSYDWLVCGGAKCQYKGRGTINGVGGYSFLLSAIDGQLPGGGGQDKFRMKIWSTLTGQIVYDNQMDQPDSADPTTVIAGGSITIRKA